MLVEKTNFSIVRMVRLLAVSRSGYYVWLGRSTSERAVLRENIEQKVAWFHSDSDEVYGAPRILADLRADGEIISRKTVATTMRRLSLVGINPKRWRTTKVSQAAGACPVDTVKRQRILVCRGGRGGTAEGRCTKPRIVSSRNTVGGVEGHLKSSLHHVTVTGWKEYPEWTRTSVQAVLKPADQLGLGWVDAEEMHEAEVYAALFPDRGVRESVFVHPDLVQCPSFQLPVDGLDRTGILGLAYRGGAPPFQADAHQALAAPDRGHGVAEVDLAIRAEVGEGPRGPTNLWLRGFLTEEE